MWLSLYIALRQTGFSLLAHFKNHLTDFTTDRVVKAAAVAAAGKVKLGERLTLTDFHSFCGLLPIFTIVLLHTPIHIFADLEAASQLL